MKQFNGYGEVKAYAGTFDALPVGGYVCGIREAYVESTSYGDVLMIKYDIADGVHKNYYMNQFNNSTLANKKYKGIYRLLLPLHEIGDDAYTEDDEKKLRNLKTFMQNIEESNPGYVWNWDERSLGYKLFGGVFGEKEYDFEGRQGKFVTLRFTTTRQAIIDDNFKVPSVLALKKNTTQINALEEVEEVGEMPF